MASNTATTMTTALTTVTTSEVTILTTSSVDASPLENQVSENQVSENLQDSNQYGCESKTFEIILESGSDNHIKWLLVTCLMRNLVTRYDAIIFGGAVRDSIRHSYASRKFYSVLKKQESKTMQESYDDPTLYPEYSDRFLLPTDIDFFMPESYYRPFKKYIYKRGFYYKEVKKMDLSYINSKCLLGQYRLVKAEIIYYNQKTNKSYPILLDMILCDKVVIPQMDDDFSVNKLLMTNKGIFVTPTCDFNYGQIREQIDNKVALCNSTISEKRYEKMNRKGWKITMNYSTFVFKLRTNTEEETCIICLEKLKIGELEVLPRHCKCMYSYCRDCIKYSLKSDGCLMCKKEMCMRKKMCDIEMYEKHQILN